MKTLLLLAVIIGSIWYCIRLALDLRAIERMNEDAEAAWDREDAELQKIIEEKTLRMKSPDR